MMRRPTATTVSAARKSALARSGSSFARSIAAASFSCASRRARLRGTSFLFGVSSTVEGHDAVGLDAQLVEQREAARGTRGEYELEASGHGGLFGHLWPATEAGGALLEAVGDATLGQIVGRHLDQHLVAASTRIRFLRMRPAVWAMISWPFSSFTRKVALGRSSETTPGSSIISSLAILFLDWDREGPARRNARDLAEHRVNVNALAPIEAD